ncbi:BTB/POZ domain-containing protein 6-B-like [Paramacrobiotus metropolitanus]|uniref:BTB/POZ domain-containing protein 6-B-like n=1 Tax=Paramacrobiotus metropolitanus TaxID=2943436 RepID=UPI002445D047|nr:BTB/POZ domain-containing protein 6-B-like [Paramacrobiotus metropolitanus]
MSRNSSQNTDAERRTGMAKMSDCVKQLLCCEDMSDVQFAVGRDYGPVKIFSAHRLIMGARSTVFHAMFFGSLADNCSAPIGIPDILPDAFANMLSFIYTDAVTDFTLDNVFSTLGCADKYDLPLLVGMCTDFVLDTLNTSNCLDILDNAILYETSAPSILVRCLCLIDTSAVSVWFSPHFGAIGQEALRIILQRDTLTANEDTICGAVDRWAANVCALRNMEPSSANRREVLGQELYLLRFPLLSHAELLDGPVKSGLLLQSEGWDIFHYKNARNKPPLPFPTKPRQNVRAEGVITCTIPDVRTLENTNGYRNTFCSEPIVVRKLLWRMQLVKSFFGGVRSLGMYLQCRGNPEADSWACQATAEFRVIPWKAETIAVASVTSHLFRKGEYDSRCVGTVPMEVLLQPGKGYVNPNDFSLKVRIHVNADLPNGIE